MGEVIPFRKPPVGTIRGWGRKMYAEALAHVEKPTGIVIYTQNAEGVYAVRAVCLDEDQLFTLYAKAELAISETKRGFIEPPGEHEFR